MHCQYVVSYVHCQYVVSYALSLWSGGMLCQYVEWWYALSVYGVVVCIVSMWSRGMLCHCMDSLYAGSVMWSGGMHC